MELCLFLLQDSDAISILTVESVDPATTCNPFLEHVGHHALERHTSRSHLSNALVGTVSLADFKLVDVQDRDEPHFWILTLLDLTESKDRDTLKMLATNLAKQRHFVWICSRN